MIETILTILIGSLIILIGLLAIASIISKWADRIETAIFEQCNCINQLNESFEEFNVVTNKENKG